MLSSIGFAATSVCLFLYGDPKIKAGQTENYTDAQDADISPARRALNPQAYPWETFALGRMPSYIGMIASGTTSGHWTEIPAGLLCLTAAAFKFVPERGTDANEASPSAVTGQFRKAAARMTNYVTKNPVRSAGICYNLSNIPYAGGALFTRDVPKIISALTYIVPDVMTLFGRKRAKQQPPTPV
ncbi:MAG: hypothetical protein WDO70_12345 [Alphaproteobacteria bacterium]